MPPILAQPANRYAVLRRTMSKCSSSEMLDDAVLGELVDLALDHPQRDVAQQADDVEPILA
jgi:hypothetical protein